MVAKLVGHASTVMTLKVYGHVANDSLEEARAAERPSADGLVIACPAWVADTVADTVADVASETDRPSQAARL